MYRKSANNATTGQATPLPFTPIEEADINKSNNRFATGTTYDDAGNVIQDTKFRNLNFSYDANGRMYKTSNAAIPANPPLANSVYDSAGQRVATQVDGVWTFFVYDAFGKMVAEYGGVPAIDEGGIKYVLQDWQGSSRAVLSNTGVVQARMDYTAFGEEINSGVGQRTTTQGFNAKNDLNQKYALTERDKATGLDHTWFRKNENRAGRWTSPDPYNGSMSLGNPQSFNRYSYVENQPTNFIDPSGLLMMSPSAPSGCVIISKNFYVDGQYDSTGYFLVCMGGGGSSYLGTRDPGDIGIGGGGLGSFYDTLTPKQGQDPHKAKCNSLRRSINSHINQAQRHLDNYGDDFTKWVAAYPPYNYLTGQLNDYQNHVDQAKELTDEYNQKCNDQGPPPPLPAFQDVPHSISKKANQTFFQRMWDMVPPLPTNKEIEKYYKPGPVFPIPRRGIPIPRFP